MNEIAVIEQLPIINEQIKTIGKNLDKRLKELKLEKLICTEETKKDLKKLRADLNNELKEFEKQRKEIKAKVFEPYEKFEEIYMAEIKDKYTNADDILRNKITEVESNLKHEKEIEVKRYFDELIESKKIDFVEFSQLDLNITLTASLKSLKEQVDIMISKVEEDLNAINSQDNSDEILVEYKTNLNLSDAITKVTNRHKALEELERKKESTKETIEQEEKGIEKVEEALQAPQEDVLEGQMTIDDFGEEEKYETKFLVKGTISQLKELKGFLENGGYEYESITD